MSGSSANYSYKHRSHRYLTRNRRGDCPIPKQRGECWEEQRPEIELGLLLELTVMEMTSSETTPQQGLTLQEVGNVIDLTTK